MRNVVNGWHATRRIAHGHNHGAHVRHLLRGTTAAAADDDQRHGNQRDTEQKRNGPVFRPERAETERAGFSSGEVQWTSRLPPISIKNF